MARYSAFSDMTLGELDRHLRTVGEVIDIVHRTSTDLETFKRELMESLQGAVAARKNLRRSLGQRDELSIGSGSEVLTVIRLAAELGVSRQTVRNMVAHGRLPPPFRLTNRTLAFKRSEVQKWIAEEAQRDALDYLRFAADRDQPPGN